jgi:dTDP-4-amino-4,6-dideoxygalactose transaminase
MDLSQLVELCRANDLFLIEDAAQAHGARLRGHAAGTVGDLGCFSFYPSKNLGAGGDAGAVVTNDSALAERVQLFRNYGQTWKYRHGTFGMNSRLDELQAAILRTKLPHLDRWNAARRRAAALYASVLDPKLHVPAPGEDNQNVFHLYPVRLPARNRTRHLLAREGIATQVHYPVPLHRQPALRDSTRNLELPVSELLAREELSLPMFPTISEEQIRSVADRLQAAVAEVQSR